MKLHYRLGYALLASVAASASWGYSFSAWHTDLSAVLDDSNLQYSQTNYEVMFVQDMSDDPLFINSVSIVGGSNWDPNIDLSTPTSFLSYAGSSANYMLGTEISGGVEWVFTNAAVHFGAMNNAVAPGVYDFTLVFSGGADASATDTLTELSLVLAVIPKFDIDVTGTVSPGVIAAGQEAFVSMKVTNNMSQDFVGTSWFYTNGGFFNGSDTLDGTFLGDWFDKHIAPGDSRTDYHTKWTATNSTPAGVYSSWLGVIGGVYYGDEHYVRLQPDLQIEVAAVPEPLTVIGLGAGLAGLIARRRRSRR